LAAALALAPPAGAQTDAPATEDPAAEQQFFEPPPSAGRFQFRWDLLLRADGVHDVPNPQVRSVERVIGRLRPGFRLELGHPSVILGARAYLSASSDENSGEAAKFDNQRPNEAALDQLFLEYRPPTVDLTLLAGKFQMPFRSTEMLWDGDLQPQGVAVELGLPPAGQLGSHRLSAGAFFRSYLFHDRSEIYGLQWSGDLIDRAELGAELAIAYYRFGNLDPLIGSGRQRTNRTVVVDGRRRFLSDFDLFDLLLRLRFTLGGRPLRAHVDYIHNFGADDHNNALELRLKLGQADALFAWHLRYVFQKVERDAVVAAFSGDEWWFHSAHHGHLFGAALGLGAGTFVELTGIVQKRDDLDEPLERILVDFVKPF
jgi:hypothetical protein